jgi:glycosyltransferase involved in cell wall biosynthesis
MKEDRSTVFYVQKAGYFCLAPLLVHFLKGNRLITDYDDYEYEQSIISKPMLWLLAHNSIFCVAASHYLQDFLTRFNKKVYYIPTGVDMDVFNNKKSPRSKAGILFTWTGIIVDKAAQENLLFIVNCFESLIKKNRRIRLEIIGGGDYMDDVVHRIASLRTDRIKYSGRIPPEQMPRYLSGVDAGLFVLVRDTKYNKSKSPTKLFEYMAEGLAIISTDIGESGKIIQNGYNGLIAKNKEEFINCAIQIATKEGLKERLGRNAYLTVKEKYSLDVLCKRLTTIINQECG